MFANQIEHQSLMDKIYRQQRHIYDASRKYYLLGRDQMIIDLRPPNGGKVLEIGCGTGRNLVLAAQKRSRANYFGIDISQEMLTSADRLINRRSLGDKIKTANADATNFDPDTLFGVKTFDRIFISYSLSMIPSWEKSLENAMMHLAENGSLHIVDFGQQSELPKFFRKILRTWLGLFHVQPREELATHISQLAQKNNRGLVNKKTIPRLRNLLCVRS